MIKFENKENGRFYYLYVTRDLLNERILCVIYGGKNITRTRVISSDSKDAMQKEIDKISKKRLKRGYELVT